MLQNRALGRPESLLRHPADSSANLLDHPGEWFVLKPRFSDENWKVSAFDLVLAGPGLLSHFRGWGGPPGARLEFGLDLDDGFGQVRNLAAVHLQSVASAFDWNTGLHQGTLVDLQAGNYPNGKPRAGLRGDLRQFALGSVTWSLETDLRYGQALAGIVWEADLLKDLSAVPLDSVRLRVDAAVPAAGPGSNLVWSNAALLQTGAQLAAGGFNFPNPIPAVKLRWTLELDFAGPDAAAHREAAALRTSIFFLLGAWVVLDSPWWTVNSLAELASRSEHDREFRPAAWDGQWDVCVARLQLAAEVLGRRQEGLRARIHNPGPALKLLEVQAVTDVWFEVT